MNLDTLHARMHAYKREQLEKIIVRTSQKLMDHMVGCAQFSMDRKDINVTIKRKESL